jgi:hypothetical protein
MDRKSKMDFEASDGLEPEFIHGIACKKNLAPEKWRQEKRGF